MNHLLLGVADLRFNGESFIYYKFPKIGRKSQNSDQEQITLVFKTTQVQQGAPLFYAHSSQTTSYQLVTLDPDALVISYKFVRDALDQGGEHSLRYEGKFADGKWHTLVVQRMQSPPVLHAMVDGGDIYMKSLEGYMRKFRKLNEIYVGKTPRSKGFVGLMRTADFQPSFISYPIAFVSLVLRKSSEIQSSNFSLRAEVEESEG